MEEVEKTRAMNLDPKRLRLFISKSNKTRQWWCERWVSSARLSASFLCLFQRFVTRKSTTIPWHSLDCIPLFLRSSICWFRIILALCWPAALCFLSFFNWQVFNHLENYRPLWEREVRTWHPRHPDECLLRVWHYKSFIKWENAVLCTSNRAALHKLKRTWQLGCLREKEHVLS